MAKRCIPFEEARAFVIDQCIGSKTQYLIWHKANRPKKIPRYPYRAYIDEWKGWNDYLGNTNEFNKRPRYRPFVEAMNWAHAQGLNTGDEWLKHVKANHDTFPSDIPTRPDVVYDDWRTWGHFLGSNLVKKVEAQQQILKESAVFYVIQEREYTNLGTVFTFGMERGGLSVLRERWNSRKFRIIKLFRYDENYMNVIQQSIDRLSTRYYGAENIRIVPNIHELVWEISNYLEYAK